ncbi:MAG: glutaminyl-tRNA synthase (glutamine-hydrolyzing) subunit B [Candidatus Doudnabacteria bacterium RIFCSPLOWO2_02_FULL_42_9]|uniref:Aspartyl/glutamyl-tRNA(Asn/Gln) amidotransferase subunit B n=1 Tax=Candidatus Doudnabacteria bacterium RIFCSPHIGHO2_01_FULL_41_86 TaxID=1817821 RepID=A0A1F5N7Z6_9BACT|nr:MAG: glutaminyl-tRNA synthase (glutamine-hydrolyzing) subunit B [Candidatus Doudnabacteria bacterium RIFCSPHIGHO2_01_FULL_41_86]OGE85770.1 MAG: glutaminyl-tRNA synthase (glutamine-hydrolyzing) subunit B [Candidatus Doudnabacteria bacterium RIFCSPHIGHO2_12_FULL_42_22]OGE87265.1 MAG: glutaminyl-tRNA synthase (glutamine-hydrolyzing) subunit B [Candidatus Doudnabacteria bacterium RIFCSPHIGHO2_02_FULL_42_25]OGE92102.1 MAG: glutaminyl-tRNA synthase (glutamine-hydrolyzing) subunit B [Candidatus Doud
MKYEPIIGLEVHVQLKTNSKMFCSSRNAESSKPNVHICEVCTGQPGTLPVINKEAVRKSVLVGLALNCQVAEYSKFDRKNYFYPDLPKGYQISQFDMPINGRGQMELTVNGQTRTIGITRAHLEEDAGKLMHGKGFSLVDYNRAGTPLLEIVSEPDIRSSEEAKQYLQELQNIMRYLGVSDADMEKGHLRCDANISLRKVGESGLPPYKVEVKNMNSFRAVANAIEFEIKRQTQALETGEKLPSETRGWIDDKGITVSQRSKEESQDYRYFPEPDLPVLHFTKTWLADLQKELPELPKVRKERLMKEYALVDKDAQTLVSYKELSEYFEHVMSELAEWTGSTDKKGSMVASWILGPFLAAINEKKIFPEESKVTEENFAELMKLILDGKVSNLAAKDVFANMFESGEDPSNILDQLGLHQVSDQGELLEVVKKVVAANPKGVEDAKKNERALGFLVGQAMKELKGKGNPQILNDLVKKELGL